MTENYNVGDLGFVQHPENISWLVEVLKVFGQGYDARLTRLNLDKISGKYVPEFNTGTFAFIERSRMQELGSKIDAEYFAKWQKFVVERRA